MAKISIFKSKVLDKRNLTEDIIILDFAVPPGFDFKAGQYLSLSVIDKEGRKIRRPLSIVNSPDPNRKNERIGFCVKIIPQGLASEFIKTLKVGDEIELFGPAGKFTIDLNDGGKDNGKDLFFIAAGVGIAPFAGIIRDLLNHRFGKKIILLKSSRNGESSLYDDEFLKLSKAHRNFEFYNVYSKPLNPEGKNVGHVQDFLEKYLPKNFGGNFYVCGLKEMISDTRKKLVELGFKESQIFEEKFD